MASLARLIGLGLTNKMKEGANFTGNIDIFGKCLNADACKIS